MNGRRLLIGALALATTALGSVVVAPAAQAAYAATGEPVWIPRNAANPTDQLRADNRALARIGDTVYLGGDFTELAPELGAPGVPQAYLAAFDAVTGRPVASFAPQLDGKVYALLADPATGTLFVGGSFTGGFAILDSATGAPKGQQLTTDGEVRTIVREGDRIYVGGQFQHFGGQGNRKMLARFDVATRAVDGFAPQFAGGMVASIDVAPNGSRVYAGGRFTSLGGAAVGKIVALSPTTGALDTSFNPPSNTTKQPVEDLEALNTKVFVAFGGGYNRFVQFSTAGAQEYAACGDGDVQEVHLVSGGQLLVGGHFSGAPKRDCTLATIPTARIALYQVTEAAGTLPTPVSPTPFSNVYANLLGVWEFLGTTMTDLWVAGDFLKVSSRNTGGLAHFVDGSTYVDGQSPSTPSDVAVSDATLGGFTVSWNASTDNKAVAGYYVVVDGTRRVTALGTSAVIGGLAPGTTATVQVQAFDVKLNLSGLSAGVPGTTAGDPPPPPPPPPDTSAPTKPGKPAMSAPVTDTSVSLTWAPSSDNVGVTGYRVYRAGTAVATTTGPSFTDTGLSPSTSYKYQVTAYDAAGNESAKSGGLTVTTAAPAGGVLGLTTTWSYTDTRIDLGTAWKDPAFVPSGPTWKSGRPEFGFGDGNEVTVIDRGGSTAATGVITWYFRTTFDVADPTGRSLVANLVRDDGAVVYLNGVEVFRSNMPSGPVNFKTKASENLNGAAETTPVSFTVPPGALVAGQNVIAVELHNVGPANGDASLLLAANLV